MEKILLRQKTVLDGGIVIPKWYCTKKIANHPNNKKLNLSVGWNTVKEGDCSPACPPDDLHGIWRCQGGQCVYIPY